MPSNKLKEIKKFIKVVLLFLFPGSHAPIIFHSTSVTWGWILPMSAPPERARQVSAWDFGEVVFRWIYERNFSVIIKLSEN